MIGKFVVVGADDVPKDLPHNAKFRTRFISEQGIGYEDPKIHKERFNIKGWGWLNKNTTRLILYLKAEVLKRAQIINLKDYLWNARSEFPGFQITIEATHHGPSLILIPSFASIWDLTLSP